jgi:hypothetical protein
MLRLLVTANIVRSSLILSTLVMEVIHTSETYVLARATRHHIPEDDTLHCFGLLSANSAIVRWAAHCCCVTNSDFSSL